MSISSRSRPVHFSAYIICPDNSKVKLKASMRRFFGRQIAMHAILRTSLIAAAAAAVSQFGEVAIRLTISAGAKSMLVLAGTASTVWPSPATGKITKSIADSFRQVWNSSLSPSQAIHGDLSKRSCGVIVWPSPLRRPFRPIQGRPRAPSPTERGDRPQSADAGRSW